MTLIPSFLEWSNEQTYNDPNNDYDQYDDYDSYNGYDADDNYEAYDQYKYSDYCSQSHEHGRNDCKCTIVVMNESIAICFTIYGKLATSAT